MLKNYTPRDTPYVLCYITYYKFAEYNQQDATLHRFLFMWNALHVSDGFSVHHQELKTAHTASGTCQTNTATCC